MEVLEWRFRGYTSTKSLKEFQKMVNEGIYTL